MQWQKTYHTSDEDPNEGYAKMLSEEYDTLVTGVKFTSSGTWRSRFEAVEGSSPLAIGRLELSLIRGLVDKPPTSRHV